MYNRISYNEIVYIGIVGSRLRNEKTKIIRILKNERKKHGNIIVVSGGATGIDNNVRWECRELGIPLLTYFPKRYEYETKGDDIFSERNELIAKKSDYMYAFPLNRRGGTMNTIGHFIRLKGELRLTIID